MKPIYPLKKSKAFEDYLDEQQRIIKNIGVSNRLGISVLNELDHRANNLLPTLKPPNRSINLEKNRQGCIAAKFKTIHGEQIQNMDSIDTHYAVKRSRRALNMPATPKRYTIQDTISSTSNCKETERSEMLCNKRGINSVGNIVERSNNSPVSEITRRIRRLRMHMNTPREHHREQERQRRKSSIARQSLNNATEKENTLQKFKGFNNLYGQIRPASNSQLNSDEEAPTFAKPTITSIQKISAPMIKHNNEITSQFPHYKKKVSPPESPSSSPSIPPHLEKRSSGFPTSKHKVSLFTRSHTTGQTGDLISTIKYNTELDLQLGMSNNNTIKPRVIASKRVFDRLYKTQTNNNNEKGTTLRKSKTQGDLAYIRRSKETNLTSGLPYGSTINNRSCNHNYNKTLPRSTTFSDFKIVNSQDHIQLHPSILLKSNTRCNLTESSVGNSTCTNRKPLWR